MGLLRLLSYVFLVICLSNLAQAEDPAEARHGNDQDLANLIPSLKRSLDFLTWKTTTTPKPQRPHVIYYHRPPPPHDDDDHHHHHPQYPHYPNYPHYPYPPPQHHWPPHRPDPEEPERPHKPHPTRPTPKPEEPEPGRPDHPHYPPHHHYPGPPHHHYPHQPPYGGYYPQPYPPFYPPPPGYGSGHGYPYFIIINPSDANNHHHHHRPRLDFSNTDIPNDEIPDFDVPRGIPNGNGLSFTGNGDFAPQPFDLRYVTENPVYSQNPKETSGIAETDYENDDEKGNARNVRVDGAKMSDDSVESNNSDTVDTKEVKLPLDFIFGQTQPRKKISDQVAVVYLRNYKKGRNLQK